MTHKKLLKRIAYLEFVNDQLFSELRYVNELLKTVGFPEGLQTIKEAAQELLHQNSKDGTSNG